jgi:hypothetical protein
MRHKITVCMLSCLIAGALGSIFAHMVWTDRWVRAMSGRLVIGPSLPMSDCLPITLVATAVVLLIWKAASGPTILD